MSVLSITPHPTNLLLYLQTRRMNMSMKVLQKVTAGHLCWYQNLAMIQGGTHAMMRLVVSANLIMADICETLTTLLSEGNEGYNLLSPLKRKLHATLIT
jgi:hypothetical protein